MSTIRLIVVHSLTKLHIKPRCDSQTCFIFNPSHRLAISKHEDGSCFPANIGFRYLSSDNRSKRESNTKINLAVNSSTQPGPPLPSQPPPNSCRKNWILGGLIAIVLPFFRNKWGPLFKLTKEVEDAVERVEHVTEVIEKVAEEVEKVAEDVGDELPEGGKLRGAFERVENVAKKAAKDAHFAEEMIDKVEEVEKEVEEFMEPTNLDQPNGAAKESNEKK
ncbi:uncharacterized protein LOC114274341 isoform X1 [Camellia sinensis]|uniref:uncharacterized protein LOC114274341 isoform X1 n=1 Tax=Camellia sinensis TaxID=4442 RepID=UPI001036837B|nr:uncharacterized protein LOC114274341 isoform X1 [Camellia sinensis]